MANSILTISDITYESMRVLENNLTFTRGVNRQYDDKFAIEGAKIGSTLNVRLPARYVGRTGATLSVENQTETYAALTLATQFGVDLQFTSADKKLSLDNFSNHILAPAMATVANKIDNDGLAQALNVYQAVGTPGTTPSSILPFLLGAAKMKFAAAPQDNLRSAVIDPNAEAQLVNALTTLYNPQEEISEQYEGGRMSNGRTIGYKFSSDANVNTYTTGPQVGSPLTNGVAQTGASLITDGWTASAASRLVVGDIFTIAGVHSVNPQSRKSTGQLQQFVVTAAFSSNGSGQGTISISPSIVASGQGQTVDVAAPDDSSIVVLDASGNPGGTASPMNLMFHRDAFILATADLPLPESGVVKAARASSKQTGLSVRMIEAYDVVNDLFITRFDVLYGWLTIYPQLAVRVQG